MDKSKTKIGWKNNLDKLLFILASLYLMLIGGLWFKNQQKIANPSTVTTINDNLSTEENTPKQIQTHNNYSQNRDNNANPNQPTTTNQENQENIDSKILPIINTSPTPVEIPPLPNNQTTVSNIPLPPPNLQPLPQPPQPKLNTPTINYQDTKAIPLPPPPIPPKPKANPVVTSIAKINKVPVINSLSSNNPANNAAKTIGEIAINNINNPNLANIAETTEGNYTLVGLVQLPDNKSMALFKINNLTERVVVGSEIGTTGWVLMAVNDKQAVVSKQNQSVYLQVGENFSQQKLTMKN